MMLHLDGDDDDADDDDDDDDDNYCDAAAFGHAYSLHSSYNCAVTSSIPFSSRAGHQMGLADMRLQHCRQASSDA